MLELGDRPDDARGSWNIGLVYEQLGNLPKAIAAMQICVDFERETGHPDAGPDAADLERLRERQLAIETYWAAKSATRTPGL